MKFMILVLLLGFSAAADYSCKNDVDCTSAFKDSKCVANKCACISGFKWINKGCQKTCQVPTKEGEGEDTCTPLGAKCEDGVCICEEGKVFDRMEGTCRTPCKEQKEHEECESKFADKEQCFVEPISRAVSCNCQFGHAGDAIAKDGCKKICHEAKDCPEAFCDKDANECKCKGTIEDNGQQIEPYQSKTYDGTNCVLKPEYESFNCKYSKYFGCVFVQHRDCFNEQCVGKCNGVDVLDKCYLACTGQQQPNDKCKAMGEAECKQFTFNEKRCMCKDYFKFNNKTALCEAKMCNDEKMESRCIADIHSKCKDPVKYNTVASCECIDGYGRKGQSSRKCTLNKCIDKKEKKECSADAHEVCAEGKKGQICVCDEKSMKNSKTNLCEKVCDDKKEKCGDHEECTMSEDGVHKTCSCASGFTRLKSKNKCEPSNGASSMVANLVIFALISVIKTIA